MYRVYVYESFILVFASCLQGEHLQSFSTLYVRHCYWHVGGIYYRSPTDCTDTNGTTVRVPLVIVWSHIHCINATLSSGRVAYVTGCVKGNC